MVSVSSLWSNKTVISLQFVMMVWKKCWHSPRGIVKQNKFILVHLTLEMKFTTLLRNVGNCSHKVAMSYTRWPKLSKLIRLDQHKTPFLWSGIERVTNKKSQSSKVLGFRVVPVVKYCWQNLNYANTQLQTQNYLRHPRNSTVMLSYKPLHQSERHPRNYTVMLSYSYKPLYQSELSFTEVFSKCHSIVFRLTTSFSLPTDIYLYYEALRSEYRPAHVALSLHSFLHSSNPTLQQSVMQITPFHLTLLQFHLISHNEIRGL